MKLLMTSLVYVLALVCACGDVRAQSAPAGNEKPATRAVAELDAANPFGSPVPTGMNLEKKEALAKGVDLKPLRDLAVFHGGRIKILDTLARESVQSILGRKDYQDFVIAEGGKITRKVKYDPLFTFMDLLIDPGYYVDRPLVHVEYLPLREAFLERLYTNKEEIEWWKRLGRLKPIDIVNQIDPVTEKYGLLPGYAQSLDDLRGQLMLFRSSHQNLMMVASATHDEQWTHLSSLPEGSPARAAVRELGAAWRSGDVDKTNAAVRALAAELPKINSQNYPSTRRGLEAVYNRVHWFEWGFWLYAFALVGLLLAFGTGRRWLIVTGCGFLVAALVMHGSGFVSRCLIAERFAIQNQFESMTGLSLFATLVGTVLMLVRRQWLFGAAAAGVGFMILITATQTGIPGKMVEREAAILNTSVLLKYHVTTVLVSYGLIALGFMTSLFYIGTHYATRGARRAKLAGADGVVVDASAMALGVGGGGGGGSDDVSDEASGGRALPVGGVARVLHDLDKAQIIVLQLAFWTLGVGILLGAWWADHSWGRWWAFDPKELWALVTWIVYLIVIHVRFTNLRDRGLTTAWLSVLGFIVMLWTYFGVNLLLPGLHAYA